jgi:uncharacterized lipoprotein
MRKLIMMFLTRQLPAAPQLLLSLAVTVIVAGATTTLAGCAATEALNDKSKIDYKSDNKKPASLTLEVPPDLTSPRNDERFSIPSRSADAAPTSAPGATQR